MRGGYDHVQCRLTLFTLCVMLIIITYLKRDRICLSLKKWCFNSIEASGIEGEKVLRLIMAVRSDTNVSVSVFNRVFS